MQDWNDYKKEKLKNPAFKAEYDKLEPEYKLASALIKARLAKKMSQAELAEKAGVKQAYIARLESGDSNPTFASINKVAKILDKELRLA